MESAKLDLKISNWKSRLIDLTKRNRLLNFKPTKSATLKIDGDYTEIYGVFSQSRGIRANAIIDLEKSAKLLTAKALKNGSSNLTDTEKQRVHNMFLEQEKQKLEKQLNGIRLKAKSSIDEKGINTLYLTIGFLKWTEVEYSKDVLISPLILVPVSLKRDSAREPYYLYKLDEEVIFNPVLEQKMKLDFGVNLPPLDQIESEDIEQILNVYKKELKLEKSWEFIEETYLGLFSFSKLVMYKDFELYQDAVENHPIIQELAGIKQGKDITGRERIVPIQEYERNSKAHESFQILDADSSQQEAILAAKNGVSFVMHGPPGTGKSQTISNIIAETLSQGKKVLFVSEKKAALEVVKKRISEKGLGDFCLDLHSHNSNKKSVLEDLRISLSKNNPSRSLIVPYSDLDTVKEHLNEYVKALHTVVQPLDKSPHSILGELSKLDEVTELIFKIPNIDSYKLDKLNQISKQIKEIELYRDIFSDERNHIWYGTLLQENSFESEAEIKAQFTVLSKKIFDLNKLFEESADFIDFREDLSFIGLDKLFELGQMLLIKPEIPQIWFKDNNNNMLLKAKDSLTKHRTLFEKHAKLKERLLENFEEGILQQNIQHSKDIILNNSDKETINGFINTYRDFIDNLFENEQFTNVNIAELKQGLYTLNQLLDSLNKIIQFSRTEITKQQVEEIGLIGNYVQNNIRPTFSWFDFSKRDEIASAITDGTDIYTKFLLEKKIIEESYLPEFINEDIDGMLNRFINDYSSIMRIFNKNFKKDKSLLNSYKRSKEKVNIDKVIKDLRSIKRLKELQKTIDERSNDWKEALGDVFQQEKTDWESVPKVLGNFYALIGKIKSSLNYEEYQKFLLTYQMEDKQNFLALCHAVNEQVNNIDLTIADLVKTTLPKLEVVKEETDNLLALIPKVEKLSEYIQKILQEKSLIAGFSKVPALTYDSINNLFQHFSDIKNMEKGIEDNYPVFCSLYGNLYKGFETEWKVVEGAINWTVDADNNFNGRFPEKFIQIINNHEDLKKFTTMCDELSENRNQLKGELGFYSKVFPFDLPRYENKKFHEIELTKLSTILKLIANSTHKLQQWTTSQRVKSEALEIGLGDFIEKVLLEQTKDSYDKIFMKRFYKIWLDFAYNQLPVLKRFDIETHSNYLNEFKNLDVSIIEMNSKRLNKKLIENKDSYISNKQHTSNELAILSRKIQKQKRHKPIRRLFSEIPNLLLSIKPCMMMSPLSVSQFIDPTSLKFDLIIFDEASQIRPEDAIGSLIRGNQVVIAGDDKQLPPTSFFSQQIEMDDEFINEEEEEAFESFESILDESLLIMPQMSLKWHYRSKHESLIAFSNKEIYKNEMYTFPSSSNGQNDGISHVYVENGVYDRGASKKNRVEAARVAELVINHFNNTPERSLGVIAFSEAQQEAIRDMLDEIRLKNPAYEELFNEDSLESFFIKNLENVQGDERDTIILSVGYGKDSSGILYYNFGPLNKDGGERRLNVAITRAKHEIIVVSSIRHTDLDDSKLNKKGPKLLKNYLYFAQTKGEFTNNNGIMNNGEVDSPFEQDVYDMLVKAGLEVRKQIGCSGYRIDLAVVDPLQPGKYLLGIECDGATYHSSKTARDRDRLRQSILESLGWNIHRIWSQDWVKRKKEITEEIVNIVKAQQNDYHLSI
ncbi:DUF4011 domain-containing protein [Bacillus sp. MUM 13]|uniref:DUF4011 domain-containing protein n=1 Tax=Bacillus sp. MUM 13 TaxID=1678001 RepID=UPI0008F5ABC1|nr:DUF4011 domain-containing protein [Bacillus sp. MUM 13]OIK10515.1 hypothetical protein BIV59_14280 [Bacillus sp. MUM 13]